MMKPWLILLSFLTTFSASAITLEDGDTIVLLGNTVIERAQKYGHLETELTLASGKADLKFRNLGWSGDTVFGHARSYFGPPNVGFERLQNDLTELKPNIVIICYGAVAAFEGKEDLAPFLKGYQALLNMITKAAKPREIIILSPPAAENLGAPLPDMTEQNTHLATYSEALAKLAADQKHHFGDLFKASQIKDTTLTDNGLHFTKKGYATISPKIAALLNLSPTPNSKTSENSRAALREKIIAKNKLFFHRWRPANETYLRLFRKYEQGENAKELPMFDPLIAQHEQEIEALRKATLSAK